MLSFAGYQANTWLYKLPTTAITVPLAETQPHVLFETWTIYSLFLWVYIWSMQARNDRHKQACNRKPTMLDSVSVTSTTPDSRVNDCKLVHDTTTFILKGWSVIWYQSNQFLFNFFMCSSSIKILQVIWLYQLDSFWLPIFWRTLPSILCKSKMVSFSKR